MSKRIMRKRFLGNNWDVRVFLLGLLLAVGSILQAEEPGSRHVSWEPRVAVGKLLSPVGSLLLNEQPGQPWQTVGDRAEIHSRDLLLALPGMRARLETQPRGVELTLWGNLPELLQFSSLQSAVILHDSRSFDLDFTLHCGRVIVANHKEKGAAHVWLRIDGAAFQLTLAEPGDAVCLAVHSFWPRGVPFALAPKKEEVPATTLNFVAVKGRISVTADGTQHLLTVPPGPASFRWDNVNGSVEGAGNLRELPAWANRNREDSPQAAALKGITAKFQAEVKDKEPRTVLFDFLAAARTAEDKERAKLWANFAVFGLAAINDIERVMQVLADPQQAQARRAAIIALRQWIGDAAGRDRQLYQFLIERLSYSKNQAATVLQLLHNALAAEEPDTYETLIAYLRHEKLAIRELAWWQLSRLVPEDIAVPYDPAAAPAERTKAYAAWKELIPSGSLPARKTKKK